MFINFGTRLPVVASTTRLPAPILNEINGYYHEKWFATGGFLYDLLHQNLGIDECG
jgi:hypothetical protein